MDVKFVPHECKISSTISKNFYQYTILDECSRKRFLYFTDEHSMYESSIALRKAIDFLIMYLLFFKLIIVGSFLKR